jgi:hypothetical protein
MSISKLDFEAGKALIFKCVTMSSVVVYGGNEKQERNGVTYLPWHAIQEYWWVNKSQFKLRHAKVHSSLVASIGWRWCDFIPLLVSNCIILRYGSVYLVKQPAM